MKKLFASLLLLLPTLFITACKAEKPASEKSLLWRITGKDLSKPSYLFGTIHMLCPDDYLWTPAMRKSLAECSKVCFEMDMDDPAVLLGANSGMMDTSGKALRDYFKPDEYKRLALFVQDSLGADMDQLQMMKPIVLQSLFMSKAVDCPLPVSYEANIMEEAMKSKKEIIGLEEVQDQIDVFNSLPEDSVIAELVQMPDSFAESKRQYARMLATYKTQDLAGLYDQIQGSKELGDQLGVFLDDRNAKWIPRMALQMKTSSVFFAVGAGHLWGPQGVIVLLRKAGYTVSPVH